MNSDTQNSENSKRASSDNWLIYGATGYTSELIIEEAIAKGHRPVIAGRNAEAVSEIAQRFKLDYRVFSLDDPATIIESIREFKLVLNCAGPFKFTATSMQNACLEAQCDYLDITGELAVFEQTLSLDARAKQQQIKMVSGVGFDVVPADSLASYVIKQVPDAIQLEVGFFAEPLIVSAGTAKSVLEILGEGIKVRRNGTLCNVALGAGGKKLSFTQTSKWALPFSWGDLATAHYAHGIPNITVYTVVPRMQIILARLLNPFIKFLVTNPWLKKRLIAFVDRVCKGPDGTDRTQGHCEFWARASDANGKQVQAWLSTPEVYRFTALCSVAAVEKTLVSTAVGAFAPAQLLGDDFVLQIPGCKKYDSKRKKLKPS